MPLYSLLLRRSILAVLQPLRKAPEPRLAEVPAPATVAPVQAPPSSPRVRAGRRRCQDRNLRWKSPLRQSSSVRRKWLLRIRRRELPGLLLEKARPTKLWKSFRLKRQLPQPIPRRPPPNPPRNVPSSKLRKRKTKGRKKISKRMRSWQSPSRASSMTRVSCPPRLPPGPKAKLSPPRRKPRLAMDRRPQRPAPRATALTLCVSPTSVRDLLRAAAVAAVVRAAIAVRAASTSPASHPARAAIIIPCRLPRC